MSQLNAGESQHELLKSEIEDLLKSIIGSNLKQNLSSIQKLKLKIEDLESIEENYNSIPAEGLDQRELLRKDYLLKSVQEDLKKYKSTYQKIIEDRALFDERTYLRNLTRDEQQKLKSKQKQIVEENLIENLNISHKIKKGAEEMEHILTKDKEIVDQMRDRVDKVKNENLKSNNKLEEFLSNNGYINSCSSQCLWMAALIEFVLMLLIINLF